jgi:hypothetical protein
MVHKGFAGTIHKPPSNHCNLFQEIRWCST